MTRKDVVDYLQQLEFQYPVHQWEVGGIHVWPLIKIQTFFIWFNGTQKKRPKKNDGKGSSLKSYGSSLLAWLRFSLKGRSRVKYFFSGAHSHRVFYGGNEYNRYFDPIMDYLEGSAEKTLLIEQGQIKPDRNYYKKERVLELARMYPLARLMTKLTAPGADVAATTEVMSCLTKIAQDVPGMTVEILTRKLNAQLTAVRAWRFLFDRIFEMRRPEYVFGLCYYSPMMYGMNASAHKKDITSVDMQHGTQGPLHVAYNNFSKVPERGYEVLPRIFWCWDTHSADQINSWVSAQRFHQVVTGGNPWLSLWPGESRVGRIRILYTLQPIDPLVPELILAAMKRTHQRYDWRLRMHPRQHADAGKIRQLLADSGLADTVTLSDAHSVPLPKSINESSVHISRFSGAIIESVLMGVPTVTIDELGVEAFAAEISAGSVHAWTNQDVDGFIALLEKLITHSAQPVLTPFEPVMATTFN